MLKLQPMLITLSKGETIQWKSTESGLLRRGMGACQAAKYAEAGLYLTCRFGFHTAGKTEVDFRTGVHQLSKHLSLFTKKGKHLAILCSDKFSCPWRCVSKTHKWKTWTLRSCSATNPLDTIAHTPRARVISASLPDFCDDLHAHTAFTSGETNAECSYVSAPQQNKKQRGETRLRRLVILPGHPANNNNNISTFIRDFLSSQEWTFQKSICSPES